MGRRKRNKMRLAGKLGIEVDKREAVRNLKEENKIRTYKTTRDFASSLRLLMCERDPALANWVESQIAKNNGDIFKIHELDKLPEDDISYDYEFQFKIGYGKDRKLSCGLGKSYYDSNILTIEPGDDRKNVPEPMKFCVQKFNEFLKGQTIGPWNRHGGTGHWEHVVLKLSPEGKLMMVVFFHPNGLTQDQVNEIKTDLKNFFVYGGGKDAPVMSLWFQGRRLKFKSIRNDQEMLELLHGAPSYTQELLGKKFIIGPHFDFQFISNGVLERFNNAIINFLDLSPETVLIDVNSASACIGITLADKCKKVFALPNPSSSGIKETLELNKIPNLTVWQEKRSDFLPKIFFKIKGEDDVKLILCPPVKCNYINRLRAKQKINKIVYIFPSAEMSLKHLLDFSDSSGKISLKGLPFLPTEAMSIGVDQSNRKVTAVLLERMKVKDGPTKVSKNAKKRKLAQSGIEPSPKRVQQGLPSDLGTTEESYDRILKLEQRLAELEARKKAFTSLIVPPSRPEPHFAPAFDNRRNANDRGLPLLLDNVSRSVPSMSSRERSFFNSNDNANTSGRSSQSLLGNTRPFSHYSDSTDRCRPLPIGLDNPSTNLNNCTRGLDREYNTYYDTREQSFGSHDMDFSESSVPSRFLPYSSSSNSNNNTRDTSDRTQDRVNIHEQDFSSDIEPASMWSRREQTSQFEDLDYSDPRSGLGNYQPSPHNRGFPNRNFGRGRGNQSNYKNIFQQF